MSTTGGTWRLSDVDLEMGAGSLKLEVITWNVGNADPSTAWPKVLGGLPEDVDMLVIGLQESTFSIKGDKDVTSKVDIIASIHHTKAALSKALPRMRIVKHCFRAQMQLYVLAEKELCSRITNVEERIENTGFLHVFPNKGGLLVSLQVDGTKLAFLSSHLAAHEGVEMCQIRNSSVEEILGGTRVGDTRFDVSTQSHHTFFMGDMNYRSTFSKDVPKSESKIELGKDASKEAEVTKNMQARIKKADAAEDDDSDDDDGTDTDANAKLSKKAQKEEDRKKIMAMIASEAWSELLKLDELSREVAACRVLSGFTPAVPSFPPTFKRTRRQIIQPSSGQQAVGSRKWDVIDTDVELYKSSETSAATETPPASPGSAKETEKARRNSMSKALATLGGGSSKAGKGADLALLPSNHVMRFYDKKRLPSFTDRILTRSLPRFASMLTLHSFCSMEEADTSDHKPVKASFTVQVGAGASNIMVDESVVPIARDPVALSKSGNLLELVLTNMKGINLAEMDWGGGSDPFVMVTADPPQIIASNKEIKSSIIDRSINPEWKDEELVIPLVTKDLDGLSQNAHIHVSVWDYDKTKYNDLIGVAAVALRDVIDAFSVGSAYEISENLLQNGLVMGKFTATAKFRVPNWTGSVPEPTAAAIRDAFAGVEKKPLSCIREANAGSCCSVM